MLAQGITVVPVTTPQVGRMQYLIIAISKYPAQIAITAQRHQEKQPLISLQTHHAMIAIQPFLGFQQALITVA